MAYLHACSFLKRKWLSCVEKNGCKKIPAYFWVHHYYRRRWLVNCKEALLFSHHDWIVASCIGNCCPHIAVTSWNCQIKHQAKDSQKQMMYAWASKTMKKMTLEHFWLFSLSLSLSLSFISRPYIYFSWLFQSFSLKSDLDLLAGKKLPCWKMIDKGGEIF